MFFPPENKRAITLLRVMALVESLGRSLLATSPYALVNGSRRPIPGMIRGDVGPSTTNPIGATRRTAEMRAVAADGFMA
jgi:hypothetical protein